MYDKEYLEALSVLKQWNDNNREKVLQYLKQHQWLNADILKLQDCIREHHLVKVAITDTCIYGIDKDGIVFMTGRGNRGIAENFA